MAIENAHFSFLQFLFSQFFEGFSEKTYEKNCRFYNKFPKSTSNCTRLRSFTIWIFFSKMSWPFQFIVHFFHFPPLLRQNLWKDVTILQLFFKCSIIICTFRKFSNLKHLSFLNGGCFKMLTIYFSFPQVWPTFAIKLKKSATVFYTYLKLRLQFYNFAKCNGYNINKDKMKSAWIYEQSLAYSSNFEQYFWPKLWKILQIL